MHRKHRTYAAQLGVTLGLAFLLSEALGVMVDVVFSQPTPTIAEALARALQAFSFGLPWLWVPFAFFFLLALGLVGLGYLEQWGYVLTMSLVGSTTLLTFNPLALAASVVLVRSWGTFFHHPHRRPRPPAEWKHLLFSGSLVSIVFGSALIQFSPQALASRQRNPVIPVQTPQRLSPRPPAGLALTEQRLQTIRSFAIVLEERRLKGLLPSYPISEAPARLSTLLKLFPAAWQTNIQSSSGLDEIFYWSNGTDFAWYSALPIVFRHPRVLAVVPPAGTVLVRTSGDVRDDLDFDGLNDSREAQFGSSPVLPDTDGDGYSDATEVGSGHDPLAPRRNQ